MKEFTLEYFINHEIWIAAKQLLDYQINDKEKHKIYNKLNFQYFESIKDKTTITSEKVYFNERVASSLFYALENEFFFHRFTIPKTGIGLRNYIFFSYPMKLVHYAIGLFLLRITQQYIDDFKKNEKIVSFYGGSLRFNKNPGSYELILNSKTTLYPERYDQFKKELKEEAENPDNKTVIKLDVQNYFDNLSIKRLLELITDRVKDKVLRANHFDSSTMEQIEFFYRFIGNGRDNIPQSDNNIMSDFLGYLYLIFGDQIIHDAINGINKTLDIITDFKIVRYVDDIYISLCFKNLGKKRDQFIYQLLNKTSDDFFQKLNLRFKGNAELYNICNAPGKIELFNNIKKVSQSYLEPESDQALSVLDKVDRLLRVVEKFKNGDISQVYEEIENVDREALKDVFDLDVDTLLSTPSYIKKLEEKFKDFNFDLLSIYPQPLIILITKCPDVRENLERYLLSKKQLTTFDRETVVQLMCQSDFENCMIFQKIQDDLQLKDIFKFIKNEEVVEENNPGYYNLSFCRLKPLLKEVNLIEQIKLRTYNERLGHYSIALNHLLSEIQSACFILDKKSKDIEKYKEPDVSNFLISKKVDYQTRDKIRKLFDRRNINPVSHPGSDTKVVWAVNKKEYFDYKKYVGKALYIVTQ